MTIDKQNQLFTRYCRDSPGGSPGLWVGGLPDLEEAKTVSHAHIHVFCAAKCRDDFVTALSTLNTDPVGVVFSPYPKNWINRYTRCHQCGRVLWWHLVEEKKDESGEQTKKTP
jgi:hypothetical protein